VKLRAGLALLFALAALVPLAVARAVVGGAFETLSREAADERADQIAAAWGAWVDARVADAGLEAELATCEAAAGSVPRTIAIDGSLPMQLTSSPPDARELAPGSHGEWHWDRGELRRAWVCRDGRSFAGRVGAGLVTHHAGDGSVRVEVSADGAAGDGDRRVLRTLHDRAGAEAATVAVVVPRVPVGGRTIGRASLELGLIGLVALAIAGALGFAVGGRLSRPLGELEKAADRIGRGDLDVKMERPTGSAGATFSAFNRMARELQTAQARAKRAERVAAWRDIARRIAHEIKNPLTPIRMSIETMRRTKERQHRDFDEIFDESTRTVLEEVERLERIVTEFSRFARLPRPRPVEIDVRDAISQVVQLHSPGGDATITDTSPRMPIKMVLASEPAIVRADRDQLTQLLVNLVQNAIDAARSRHGEGGHVEVACEAVRDGVRVTVSDDGPGIPEEERAKVLEPYYTTKAKGTGLGLAIVDRIVSDHGGTLEIGESRAGGAAITFTLTREGPAEDPEASQST
jgi:signal transduction histidine kinase